METKHPTPKCICLNPWLSEFKVGYCEVCNGLFADNRVLTAACNKEAWDYYLEVTDMTQEEAMKTVRQAQEPHHVRTQNQSF